MSNETYGNDTTWQPKYDDVVDFATNDTDYGIVPRPIAASELQPDWFDPDETAETITNALTEGWILRTPADVHIVTDCDECGTEWRTKYDRVAISMHSHDQMKGFNIPIDIVKFHSYWTAKLPEGYSALMTKPFGIHNEWFTPFSGCIDFDKFPTRTHAPTLFEARGSFKINAGTPTFQFIPFKRDDLIETAVARSATEEEIAELESDRDVDEEPKETTTDVKPLE